MRRPNRLPRYPYGSPGVTDVINLEDNEKINFGDGKDTSLYWDGTNFVIDDATGLNALIIENTTAGVLRIRSEGAQLILMPAITGTEYPYIKLFKDGDYRVYLKAAKSFYIYEEGVKIFDIAYASDIPTITISVANKDLQFIPNGTGRVRFGTHVGSGDVVANGHIEIKDAAGNTRKLMTTA